MENCAGTSLAMTATLEVADPGEHLVTDPRHPARRVRAGCGQPHLLDPQGRTGLQVPEEAVLERVPAAEHGPGDLGRVPPDVLAVPADHLELAPAGLRV